MANRRMFSKEIIDSDVFLELPLSSQALYFHLSMRADDDGIVNNPKKIARIIEAKEEDFANLLKFGFIGFFESGMISINHWLLHNYIQKDRYRKTIHTKEWELVKVEKNNVYTLDTDWIQDGYRLDTFCVQFGYAGKVRLELDKNSIDNTHAHAREEDIKKESSKTKKQKNKSEEEEEIQKYDFDNPKDTKKNFEIFIKNLYEKATIKTKVTKGSGDKGYIDFKKIKDKRKLFDDYLKHQEEKGGFSSTFANFMINYEYFSSYKYQREKDFLDIENPSEDYYKAKEDF